MNEFTRSLLYVALLVCIPIVTACIQKGIAVFIEFIAATALATASPISRTSRCTLMFWVWALIASTAAAMLVAMVRPVVTNCSTSELSMGSRGFPAALET